MFSEADAEAGYNLALNLWIDRQSMLSGIPPRTSPASAERFPTLQMVTEELALLDERAARRKRERAKTSRTGSSAAAPKEQECSAEDG